MFEVELLEILKRFLRFMPDDGVNVFIRQPQTSQWRCQPGHFILQMASLHVAYFGEPIPALSSDITLILKHKINIVFES